MLAEAPPVLVDWLPWKHTFGGNHNFGMVLYNGGTMYIDEGKPVPALIGETLRNLREVAPTVYFNVPTGFEAIANAMKTDLALRKNFLSRVSMFFYAGAALAQPIWDSLYESEEAEIGQRIVMACGLGMTESGPFGLFVTSPNITPGYWRAPEETAAHFDEEGYFRTGDALKWIDEQDIHQGLKFYGRIAEDFKLATGTFVSVGPLRSKIIAAGASMAEVLASAPVLAHFQNVVDELATRSTGSANRIDRLLLLDQPPSIDKGEITDKGSINQRTVLQHRDALVNALHEGSAPHILKPRSH